MQKSLGKNTDLSIDFIRLLSMHDKVLSQEFSVIISKIHRGSNPEKELSEYLSPSEDFNIFLRNYLTQKFTDGFFENELIDTQNEKNVEIFTNSLESRLSLCFFIGIFFPIGMSFLIIFIKFSLIWMIFFIFLYSFFFHKLLGKIINEDHQLIGMINNYSKKETRKLDEFINFISAFALNLKFFSSPEKAFIMSYFDNKSNYRVINGLLDNCTTKLINFQESFYNILDYFAYKLSSVNYFVIINALKKMLKQSSILTSDKISKLVKLVQKHKKLQDKLEEIFYAETFKVIIFIVLLPVIIGSIGGMIPFFDIFTGNIDELKEVSINSFLSFLFIFDIVLLSLILLINVLISIHFFIRIVKIEQKNVLYLLAIFLFIFSFWFSFVNTFQILL